MKILKRLEQELVALVIKHANGVKKRLWNNSQGFRPHSDTLRMNQKLVIVCASMARVAVRYEALKQKVLDSCHLRILKCLLSDNLAGYSLDKASIFSL